MGEMTIWDRIWPWLRHPLSTAAATIAFRYVENHPRPRNPVQTARAAGLSSERHIGDLQRT